MRHDRKSKTKRFNGFKEHLAADLDSELIYACAVTPANMPEEGAAPQLQEDMARQGTRIQTLHSDRAYINRSLLKDVEKAGGEVLCKPYSGKNNRKDMFNETDFKIDMRSLTITCPKGQRERLELGQTVEFDPKECGACALRGQCTYAASGRGRMVRIAEDEKRQLRRRKLPATKSLESVCGRTGIEHRPAHVAARKEPRPRGAEEPRRPPTGALIHYLGTIRRKAAA